MGRGGGGGIGGGAAALWLAALLLAAAAALSAAAVGSTAPSPTSSTPPTPSTSSTPSTPLPSSEASPTAAATLVRQERLPKRDIARYRSYKDVNVLPFEVPSGTRIASFNFTVTEQMSSSVGRKCEPRNVTVVLKWGSLPVINPDGARFPPFYTVPRLPQLAIEFFSMGSPALITVERPRPGPWYAVAFLSYTDPNDDKILQQGLSASCMALIESTLDVSPREEVAVLSEGTAVVGSAGSTSPRASFRFWAPSDVWRANLTVRVSAAKCSGAASCPPLSVATRAAAFPDPDADAEASNGTLHTRCAADVWARGDPCVLDIQPEQEQWYYVTVEALPDKSGKNLQVDYTVEVSLERESVVAPPGEDTPTPGCEGCWPRFPLARQSYFALFMYNFVRAPDPAKPSAQTQSQALNVSTRATTLLAARVLPVRDVGGTLTLELRLDRTAALDNATATAQAGHVNVTVLACLAYGHKQEPVFPDGCADANTGAVLGAASVRVNTSSGTVGFTAKQHVPFPEPGPWLLSFRPFCFVANASASASTSTSADGGASDVVDPHANADLTEVDCGDLNATQLTFVLDSEMCGADSCGRWGHCNNYLSGGIIFSTCVCAHGYRGWGCTDDERIESLASLLTAALLLTLSNLPFAAAAIVAVRRRYYTEALVYTCTLFFSTFYHACEAGEDVYSYCLMKLQVLQFCDFYSAILALWVTLVAMADLPPTPKSLMHMAGAVGIALGTEYDRTSLTVFLIPALVGLALVGARWALRCRARRACYPHASYWKFFLPPGVVLVVVGLVCYSFLQTRVNYKYVHSVWHALMACAIILVLPARRHAEFGSVESDESVDSAEPFWRRRKFWLCKIR